MQKIIDMHDETGGQKRWLLVLRIYMNQVGQSRTKKNKDKNY